MKIIDYTETSKKFNIPEYILNYAPEDKILFFDIETTGFAAKDTTLYLIGALWYENNTVKIRQWFNEDGYSEAEILKDFHTFCEPFFALIHFNGCSFDLPYLNQKAKIGGISLDTINNLIQIDIYKEIRCYKTLLGLDNMKQVSIEQYLGIHRIDTYTGKELIKIYQRYVARPDEKAEHCLLLHNHDDLLGMPLISTILNYKQFMEKLKIESLKISSDDNRLSISFFTPPAYVLPRRITYTKNGIYLNAFEQTALLQIPVIYTTLKHFFANHKDYYYLPTEDMAIHKSVAAYVESSNKIKASKDTCYIKQTGNFIPCTDRTYKETFRTESNSKESFLLLDSFLSLSGEQQKNYIKQILYSFL